MLLIKIKRQDLLHDGKNISDLIAYFTRVYMNCLIFPSASQLVLIASACKIRWFGYETKESGESNNHTKIGHSLKRHLKEIPTRVNNLKLSMP